MAAKTKPCIWVLAGTNGAGKSSTAGAFLRENGGDYYNPDEAAQRILAANPNLEKTEVNSIAWNHGVELLRAAITGRQDYIFETTLGGEKVTRLLEVAIQSGHEVRVWFIGLATPEMHIERVASRVKYGGHDIPEEMIRRRYVLSQLNLIRLLSGLKELRLFDNSANTDPVTGTPPKPQLIVHYANRRVLAPNDLRRTPDWAKAIVAAVLKTRAK